MLLLCKLFIITSVLIQSHYATKRHYTIGNTTGVKLIGHHDNSIRHQRHNHRSTNTMSDLFNTNAPRSGGPCRYLVGTKKQNHQCRKDVGLPEVIKEARRLAVKNCAEEFQYDRWNCSIETRGKRNVFHKVYRETAFVHALTAAALTFSIARACSEGKLVKCRCGTDQASAGSTVHSWLWGGCSDNLKHGKRMAKKFLDLRLERGNQVSELMWHNSAIGIDLAVSTVESKCKCHGVSGSCSTKTCWRKLSDFKTTAHLLRKKYNHAMRQLEQTNTSSRRSISTKSMPEKSKTALLYLETSPTFCAVTKGRRCENPENCSILCCGRGYSKHIHKEKIKCRCRFHKGQCCHVICDSCDRSEEIYYCK